MSTPSKPDAHSAAHRATFPRRAAVLLYGVGSYGIGVAALVLWILSMLGILPFSGLSIESSAGAAAAINLALMAGFALQHSIMARKRFKESWTRVVGVAAERSTFVLATGLVLGPLVLLWQPMPATVWEVSDPIAAALLTGVAVLGWAYLFAATFAISHFELFGLRQVYQYFRGEPVTPVPFRERWMYRFDRHPIMTGALVGMWFTPQMNADHLLFAATATVYVVIGVFFEERSLRRQWGTAYDDYRSRVRSIVPTIRPRVVAESNDGTRRQTN